MMQTKNRRHAFACLTLSVALATPLHAQTATDNSEDECKKLVKVDEEIKPLGESSFGEENTVVG